MPPCVKYVHTNIVARDWQKLARFYVEVLGCTPRPPERDLEGDWLDALTSLKQARIRGIHLGLPGHGDAGPTLEIFEYSQVADPRPPMINRPGLAHLAFLVDDVDRVMSEVRRNGGSSVGRVVSTCIEGAGTVTVVYARDPEGNIIELQAWR